MAKWKFLEINFATCTECEDYKMCNIYEIQWTCNCLKCTGLRLRREKNICGACMGKWLKSRDMDNAE